MPEDAVCARCGGPTKGTIIHPTTKPFHVPCVHDPDRRRCYVDCEDCKATVDADMAVIQARHRAARG